jgi:hypothetical protein
MRKILAMAGVAITSMLFTGSAFAQGAPPTTGTPAPGAPTDTHTDEADKKIGIGVEGQFLLILGDVGKETGPLIGPLVRFGYRVIPNLELTARTGYLFGLGKTPDGAPSGFSTSISNIPIWLGARYFFMEPYAGLYGAAELAINLMTIHGSGTVAGVDQSSSTGFTREGVNLGVGYVISKDLPIDIRAQLSVLNLLGKASVAGVDESTALAIGLSAGYTFQF